MRLAAILLVSLWLSGCFVADEIRHGDALIEQHSVGWREKKKKLEQAEAAAAKEEAETRSKKAQSAGPDVKGKLAEWWHENVDEEPAKADPDDKIVSCKIDGKLQFLRKSDCQLRRGHAAELKTKGNSAATAPSKSGSGA